MLGDRADNFMSLQPSICDNVSPRWCALGKHAVGTTEMDFKKIRNKNS